MCWSNYMVTPIVLKKPLRVYKVGTSTPFNNFISLFRNHVYYKCQTMPTVEINPKFERLHPHEKGFNLDLYNDCFYIHKGYHSYLTKKMAKYMKNLDKEIGIFEIPDEEIGIFEIPAGATIYVNYGSREVVSTDIKYLGLLEE